MLRRAEDLGPGAVQFHRLGAQRAADLPGGGGAGMPSVAVSVLAGVDAQLVSGELGCLLVVVGDVGAAGAGWQRDQLQQRWRCLGAVETSVADDGAVVGSPGSAVVWVQVLHEAGAGS